MVNLLSISSLLFSLTTFNSTKIFRYDFSNTAELSSYCSINESTGQISYGLSTLKVGEYYENGSYVQYSSVLRFTFPSFSENDIENAALTMNWQSGSTGSIDVEFKVGEVGFDNTSWMSVSSVSKTGNQYTVSLKNALLFALFYEENVMYVRLSRESGGVSLQGDSANMPFVSVSTTQSPSSSTYGCATPFQQIIDNGHIPAPDDIYYFNCYGYAIDIRRPILLSEYTSYYGYPASNYAVEQSLIPYMIRQMKAKYDVNTRRIDSYVAPIFPFERRIAFRVGLSTNSFHFLRQLSNGDWAYKNGTHSSTLLCGAGLSPETYDWGNAYDSDVFYFAVNNNGGTTYYEAF